VEKALQKVVQLLGPDAAQLIWRARFERVQHMSGANQKFRRIADTSDKEQLGDYLAEVLFALIFAGLGFRVEIEPLGEKGPDLRILRDDHSAIVETMRFRKIYPGPPMLSLDETSILPVYGNLPRDIRKAFEKILAKFPQLSDEESIIAIWNDDEDLEEIEVEQAVLDLRNDATRQILSLPRGLSFVFYGSKWIGAQQLYCFPLRFLIEPHQAIWSKELENSRVGELVQRALDHL